MREKLKLGIMTLEDALAVYIADNPVEFIDGSNKDAHLKERTVAFLYGATAMSVLYERAMAMESDADSIKTLIDLREETARLFGLLIECDCPDCRKWKAERAAQTN